MPQSQDPVDELGRPVLEPGPDHRITLAPAGGRVRVRHGATVVAETVQALLLREDGYPPVPYLPTSAVVPGALRASTRTTYCPFKGEAVYWSVVDGDEVLARDAAWGYPEARPAVTGIEGRVAFDPALVTVELDAPTA